MFSGVGTYAPLIIPYKVQEEACILPRFDSEVAWDIGTLIRTRCQQMHEAPAVIYIVHANSTQLFFAPSRLGTLPDYMHWVKRKEATVLRWGASSVRMRLEALDWRPTLPFHEALKDKYGMSDLDTYTCHGGGFPVMVKNVEGVVGVIVVHGLSEDDNHSVIVDSIQDYLARNKEVE